MRKISQSLVLLTLMALTFVGCTTVGAGEVGVKTRFGKVVGDGLEPGLHTINPFVEHVNTMSTQTMAFVVTATAVSKDMQEVKTQATVNYAMNPEFAGDVYSNYRKEFEQRVLGPTTLEAIKTATAQYNVEDAVSKRGEVKEYVTKVLAERVAPTHRIVAVMLTDFEFSEAFSNAIEAKVTATQQALEEKNKLESIRYQSEQKVLQAQAQAKTIEIQSKAIESVGGSAYLQLQWINKWNGQLPTMITGNGQGTIMMLNPNGGK